MKTLKAQRGLSAIGWLFVISLFGFGLLVVSKLGPHYLDNRFVSSVLQSIADDPDVRQLSAGDIRSKLSKEFTINNIRGKPTQSVDISTNANGLVVSINYEERVHLLHNIDVVLTFNNMLDTARPQLCCSPPPELLNPKGK